MAEVEPSVPGVHIAGRPGQDRASDLADPIDAPPEFPGCRAIRLTRDAVEDFDGRLEYWEASSETAWMIAEPTTIAHEGPTRRLGRLAELIAAVRGSPIDSYGSMDLVLLDERGQWRRLMQADETLYLHPGRAHLPEVRLVVGEHDLPDVVLEVDYSTDVRRGKLGLYRSWGFPEIWVEVPARYRARRRPGLTIHVREADGYREWTESRAFPGWTATEIHAALSGEGLSEETHRVLERVGRRLGALEGTGPDDSPLLRSLRGEARAAGLAEGRAAGADASRAAACFRYGASQCRPGLRESSRRGPTCRTKRSSRRRCRARTRPISGLRCSAHPGHRKIVAEIRDCDGTTRRTHIVQRFR